VRVLDAGVVIAIHQRSYDRGVQVEHLAHITESVVVNVVVA
jgi:hypothetical protein